MSYRVHITLRYFECPQNFPPKVASTGLLRATPPQPGVSRGKNQKTKRNGKTDRGANTKQNFEVMSRVDKQIDLEARCLSMFPCLASCCHQHQHHHHLIIINITLPTLNCLFQSLHSISSAQYQPLFDPILPNGGLPLNSRSKKHCFRKM